jgi:hypothetical protein
MRSRERSVLHSLGVAALVTCVLSNGACSEEDEAPPAPPQGTKEDCRQIANRCHYYDTDGGSQRAHDCHEIGHDAKDFDLCASMKSACLAECPERDSGDQGGSGGMTSDAGPDSSGSGGTGAGTNGASGTAGDDAGIDSSMGAGGTAGSSGTLGSGGSAGASGSGGHGGTGGAVGTACEQLASICHGIPGAFTEHCHDLGHDENEPACEAELSACLAACRG